MDFKNVHHLRVIQIRDEQGKTTSAMQYSRQNISRFRPDFVEVPFKDQQVARELYLRFGGRLREAMKFGTEVICELSEVRHLSSKIDAG